MTSTVNTISPVLSEVVIEVPEEDVKKEVDKQYALLRRTAKISGFRKGKAPRQVLTRMFGEAVLAEARQEIVAVHLETALVEHDLRPLSQPSIDGDDVKEGGPYRFTAKFENRPKLEDIVTEGIALEKYRTVVTEEEVQKELDRIRSARADVADLETPRPAQAGDLLKIKSRQWVDGDWKDTPWPEQEVIPGETQIENEVEEALLGMNVGDEKVVEMGPETEGERARYMIILKSIQARKLPALDDEFAKDLGEFETLADLKKKIEEQILKNKVQVEERRLRDTLFDALREKNPLDLPPTLVQQQALQFRMRVMRSLGMINKENGGPTDEEEQAMFDRSEKAASDMVHQHLLSLECARIGEIKIDDDAMDVALTEIAEEAGLPLPMVKAEYAKEGRRDELAHQLLEKKIFDFLLPKVTITEVDPPGKPDEKEE